MKWEDKVENIEWVCGVKTYNSGPTVYACLQAAAKTFKNIIVTDDGSKDETHDEIKRFIDNYPDINVKAFNVDVWDPIPDLVMKRDHGNTVDSHPTNKSHTKAQIKNYEICKKQFPDAIYFSLEDDVILYKDIKERIKERLKQWSDPSTDCEYFNVANMVNEEYMHIGKNHPGMKRRKLYENAGDWTFCCIWTGGEIKIGPDPGFPWGACMFPWLPKNQTGKKGQDTDLPYGNHLLYYRRTRAGYVLPDRLRSMITYKQINDPALSNECFKEYEFNICVSADINTGVLSVKELK